jgi:hypothetical protein
LMRNETELNQQWSKKLLYMISSVFHQHHRNVCSKFPTSEVALTGISSPVAEIKKAYHKKVCAVS